MLCYKNPTHFSGGSMSTVSTSTSLFHDYIKPNATSIEFLRGRVKFGKINSEGEFYYPLGKNGKVQSGTKDSIAKLCLIK